MTDQGLREAKEISFRLYLKIKSIDPEAAEYFWKKLNKEGSYGFGLSASFDWQETPQGYKFWYDIAQTLDHITWGL